MLGNKTIGVNPAPWPVRLNIEVFTPEHIFIVYPEMQTTMAFVIPLLLERPVPQSLNGLVFGNDPAANSVVPANSEFEELADRILFPSMFNHPDY